MSADGHIDQDDLALFAMKLFSAAEMKELSAHLENCVECRRELAAVQGDLAVYAHSVELHSPPALARERLMKQVAREKRTAPVTPIQRVAVPPIVASGRTDEPEVTLFQKGGYSTDEEDEHPRRGAAPKVLPWVGWAIAAGLAVAATNFYQERDLARSTVNSQSAAMARLTVDAAEAKQLMDTLTDRSAMRVTLRKPDAKPAAQGKTTYVPGKGALVFTASNMDPLEQYKVYELWLVPADGRDPIAAGSFKPDAQGNASVILPELPKGVEAKAFAITIEDESSPKTTPTMPIIMSGA